MHSIFRYFLILVSILFLLPAHAGTLSGVVSLPEGKFAGANGVTIEIASSLVSFSDGDDKTVITIPAGENSANYSVNSPEFTTSASIYFNCGLDCLNLDVTYDGAWSSSNGVVGRYSFLQSSYDANINHNIDINLEHAIRIKGNFNFPRYFKANGNEFLSIEAIPSNSNNAFLINSFSDFAELSRNNNSATFDFNVPIKGGDQDSWIIEFYCERCTNEIPSDPLYAPTFVGGLGVDDKSQAYLFTPIRNFSSINLLFPGEIPAPVIPDTAYLSAILLLLSE